MPLQLLKLLERYNLTGTWNVQKKADKPPAEKVPLDSTLFTAILNGINSRTI